MIKYGTHCYVLTERWSDDELGLLDTAKELGLDVFEIAVGDDVRFAPQLTRHRAESLDLELVISPGGEWPVTCDLSSDNSVHRELGLTWHKKQIDLGAKLGAIAYTGALYGHPGTVQRRIPPTQEYERTAGMLHHLAEYGSQYGVKIVIEPMSHFRTHVVNKPEQAMRLIAMADHPNLFVLLDTYHLVTEIRDYAQAVRVTKERLWGLHACENDRGPPGRGLVPWKAIFDTLCETGFDGYLLFESYNSSLGDFAHRRGMFHDVCPDGQAFIQHGLAFLQAGLSEHGSA
jgi:D-psicose/D-tagatose/L-ribulose 3-epimerase